MNFDKILDPLSAMKKQYMDDPLSAMKK